MQRALCLILCLGSIPASAGEQLQQAQLAFQQMEYPHALRLAQQALQSPDNQPRHLILAYRLIGDSLAVLNQPAEAFDAYRRLLTLDPSFRLPETASPKMAVPFQQALDSSDSPIAFMHRQPFSQFARGTEPALTLVLVADPLRLVSTVRLVSWNGTRKMHRSSVVVRGVGSVSLNLPRADHASHLQYYFEAVNEWGGVVRTVGSLAKPYRLTLAPPDRYGEYGLDPDPEAPADRLARKAPHWYKSWLFWSAVGVFLTGATVATSVALND